jgi:hypothetical protein
LPTALLVAGGHRDDDIAGDGRVNFTRHCRLFLRSAR